MTNARDGERWKWERKNEKDKETEDDRSAKGKTEGSGFSKKVTEGDREQDNYRRE